MSAWLADALVVLALAVMTIGVWGLQRMPDVYTQLHATSKAVFLGVIAILAATALDGDGAVLARTILIAAALILTTPVSAHVVAGAAYLRREPLLTPGAVDESGHDLAAPREPGATRRRGRRAGGKRIVVGYDGSEHARRALERAAVLAGDRGSVMLVTAARLLPSSPAFAAGSGEIGDEQRAVLEEGRTRLVELGVEVRTVASLADPADAIVRAATTIEADVIVVGSRGRNVAARMLLGSVSAEVLERTDLHVEVV